MELNTAHEQFHYGRLEVYALLLLQRMQYGAWRTLPAELRRSEGFVQSPVWNSRYQYTTNLWLFPGSVLISAITAEAQ